MEIMSEEYHLDLVSSPETYDGESTGTVIVNEETGELLGYEDQSGGLDFTRIAPHVTRLPNNFTVYGSLWLTNTAIEELPENLTIHGSLFMSKTNVVNLPDNLYVQGLLMASYTKHIDYVGENIYVGNSVWAIGSSLGSKNLQKITQSVREARIVTKYFK